MAAMIERVSKGKFTIVSCYLKFDGGDASDLPANKLDFVRCAPTVYYENERERRSIYTDELSQDSKTIQSGVPVVGVGNTASEECWNSTYGITTEQQKAPEAEVSGSATHAPIIK